MTYSCLVIDDHDALRVVLCKWLHLRFPNCVVLEARAAEEALALVEVCPPTVVLMDVSLPLMSGIEATRQVKAIAPQTRVVMISVYESLDYQNDAAAAGASAYVFKRNMCADLGPILQDFLCA